MISGSWGDAETQSCKEVVSTWVSMKPVESNPQGLEAISCDVSERFSELGFQVEAIANPDADYRPLLIATRELDPQSPWIGFFGHYDVEPVEVQDWTTDPWELSEQGDRWYGRGVADNLVPLAQRLILFEQFLKNVNVVYCLQGEEEIGSPFANEHYQNIELPQVHVWIEETGYFYKDGRQRLMYLNSNPLLEEMIESCEHVLSVHGRGVVKRNRPLNKAFGADRCPCLTHLVNDTPYLAIGPNDDSCKVHGSDESISTSHFEIVAEQYLRIAEVVGGG